MVCLCKKPIHRQLGSYAATRQVNNIMQRDIPESEPLNNDPAPAQGPVNEAGSIHISGFVRVFDPQTQEILVEARE